MIEVTTRKSLMTSIALLALAITIVIGTVSPRVTPTGDIDPESAPRDTIELVTQPTARARNKAMSARMYWLSKQSAW